MSSMNRRARVFLRRRASIVVQRKAKPSPVRGTERTTTECVLAACLAGDIELGRTGQQSRSLQQYRVPFLRLQRAIQDPTLSVGARVVAARSPRTNSMNRRTRASRGKHVSITPSEPAPRFQDAQTGRSITERGRVTAVHVAGTPPQDRSQLRSVLPRQARSASRARARQEATRSAGVLRPAR